MPRLAGALLDRQPGPKYTDALRFAELRPQLPVPRPATFKKWRADLPQHFVLSLEAPKTTFIGEAGELRIDEGVEERAEWLKDAAKALRASFVVVHTSSKITPSKRDRDRLLACVDLIRDDAYQLVWDPSGMWEADERAIRAAEWGMIAAFDPGVDHAPPGDVAYARLRTFGARKRIADGVLYDAADRLAHVEDAYVAIESARSFNRAMDLQALFDQQP